MFQSGAKMLMQTWSEIRAERSAPSRAAFDPTVMGAGVTRLFMLQRAPSLPYRLAGAAVETAFGRPLRGASFLDLWSASARAAIRSAAADAVREVECVVLYADTITSDGQKLGLEIVLAPLAGRDGAGVDRLVGVQSLIGEASAAHGERLGELMHRLTLFPGAYAERKAPPIRLATVDGRRIA